MANPPSDYYVDPSIAANSGTGTIGDPYGDLQYALDTVTRDSTDGDRFNIKAGTDEILSAALSLTTYGTPSNNAPLIFQGYTSAQGDGGIGQIDCNGFIALTNAGSGIYWYEMELHSGPAAGDMLIITQYSVAAGCYFHGTNGTGVVASSDAKIIGCRFEDLGSASEDMLYVSSSGGTYVYGNYFKQGASRTCRYAVYVHQHGSVINNIISIDGSSTGIRQEQWGHMIEGNTILSNAGTGVGIDYSRSNPSLSQMIINNYVEGFSGVGGIGINSTGSGYGGGVYGKNAVYNNTTNIIQSSEHNLELGDNEVLSVSGIEKSGADTFANRFTYFAPVDTGNMQTGGFPEA